MTSIRLNNAKIVDPLHPQNGQVADLAIANGRYVDVAELVNPDQQIDLAGALTLAGGIDIHTHIGGGKTNIARLLTQEIRQTNEAAGIVWPTGRTGDLYNRMGYTACFEPAMLLSGARHTHLELADTPNLDCGAYVVLGNEDWLLQLIGSNVEDPVLDSLVAWSIHASRALAVKVVNPGGINAFKFDQRMLDVDSPHPVYGAAPRDILKRLSASIDRLGLDHPLHLHASNLGMPGNIAATLSSLDAVEGRRIHLTHAQFNCYSTEGPHNMGSGAEQLANYVNTHRNVSLDVGQIVFGQTITISADIAAQYRNRVHARPRHWYLSDHECQAGCGAVPIKYQDHQYVHSLQWTIGLELMLLVDDPWRIFLTTDHPNGGPFTSYPHLIRLLMDRTFRKSQLERIHPSAAQRSLLQDIEREYTLEEIAIVTRAAPAKILGLQDRGTLQNGAIADLAVYQPGANWESTFSQSEYLLKHGQWAISNGRSTTNVMRCETIRAQPDFDAAVVPQFAEPIERILQQSLSSIAISDDEYSELIRF